MDKIGLFNYMVDNKLHNSNNNNIMKNNCSFCSCILINNTYLLSCQHILCYNCMKETLNELGLNINLIQKIINNEEYNKIKNNENNDNIEKKDKNDNKNEKKDISMNYIQCNCPCCQEPFYILSKLHLNDNSEQIENNKNIIKNKINEQFGECKNEESKIPYTSLMIDNKSSLEIDSTIENYDNNQNLQTTSIQLSPFSTSQLSTSRDLSQLQFIDSFCYIHNEPIKWYCTTCFKVICDECLSEGFHRAHEFVLCKTIGPSLKQTLQEALHNIRSKRENINTRIALLESRGDETTYITPKEAIINHCNKLRVTIDELENTMLKDLHTYMSYRVGVNKLQQDLNDLESYEERFRFLESYNNVETCILFSSFKTIELNLQQLTNQKIKSNERLPENDGFGFYLEPPTQLLEKIKYSGSIFMNRISKHEVYYS